MAYLTDAPLDLGAVLAEVGGVERGGVVLFVGSVRRGADDGLVVAIEYTAYEAMAVAECARIVAEAQARWPEARFALRHRVGTVPAGEASIAVAAGAAHRADAFAACRFVIEEAKRRLPVWKKERLADGSARWHEQREAVEGPRG